MTDAGALELVEAPLITWCTRCARKLTADKQTVWHDRSAEPWKAYYCDDCKDKRIE